MDEASINQLDDIIHAKARLGIMSILMTYGKSDFTHLKKKLGLSDGNLGAHIRKLEEAEYIVVEKTFVRRKPKTVCELSEKGKEAYKHYLETLEKIIQGLGGDESDD